MVNGELRCKCNSSQQSCHNWYHLPHFCQILKSMPGWMYFVFESGSTPTLLQSSAISLEVYYHIIVNNSPNECRRLICIISLSWILFSFSKKQNHRNSTIRHNEYEALLRKWKRHAFWFVPRFIFSTCFLQDGLLSTPMVCLLLSTRMYSSHCCIRILCVWAIFSGFQSCWFEVIRLLLRFVWYEYMIKFHVP